MLRFSLLTWNHVCTSLTPVEPLMPFWTVNLEGLSALVWHTFSLQLTYNSEQNYTKPITMRMRVKNQSHVSWRSDSRHFIRSLWVEFYSCTFLTARIYWPCGFSKKSRGCWHRSLMQRSSFPFAFISGALYCNPFCTLYNLKSPVVCNARFNKVTRHTPLLPVMAYKKYLSYSTSGLQSAKKRIQTKQRQSQGWGNFHYALTHHW